LPHGRSSETIGGMQATHALLPGTQAPLPGPEAAFIGLAAFAVVMIPFLWPLVDHFDTMAHEGAHAAVGAVSVPAAIALLAVVMRYAHDGLEEVIIYAVTWLMLLSGTRNAIAHGAHAGDAGNLSRVTHLPRRLWAVLWIAGTLLSIATGGKWLVLRS
jgi:hypothetical protein